MKTKKIQQWLLLLFCVCLHSQASAHGSVVDAADGCTIRMDFYSAHFTVFQPATRGHREFCEDLPDAAETVFVLEYLHDSLRDVPIEFRIIRNTSRLGRFIKWSDIEQVTDLSELTVFYQRVSPQVDGVLTVLHEFREPGNYVGIVSAPHPSIDKTYHAVFPFRVGRPLLPGWTWPAAMLALLVVAWRRRPSSKRRYTL
jgi:hypothetical protein